MSRQGSVARGLAFASAFLVLLSACGSNGSEGGGSEAGGDDPITLTFSSHVPQDSTPMRGIEKWMEIVEESTDGKVQFETHYAEALLPGAEALRGTGDGRTDMAWVANLYFPSELPLTALGSVTFQGQSPEGQSRAMTELVRDDEAFAAEWERNSVRPILFTPVGTQVLGFTKPVESLSDLQGRSVRAVGYTAQAIAGVGMTPVGLSAAEVFESLDRGVVDGFGEFPLDAAVVSYSLHETAPHFVEFGGGSYVASALAINQNVWDGLDDDIKEAMDSAYEDYLAFALDDLAQVEEQACNTFLEEGGTITILDDSEVSQWRSSVESDLVDDWIKAAVNAGTDEAEARDTLDTFQGLVAAALESSDRELGTVACAAQQ